MFRKLFIDTVKCWNTLISYIAIPMKGKLSKVNIEASVHVWSAPAPLDNLFTINYQSSISMAGILHKLLMLITIWNCCPDNISSVYDLRLFSIFSPFSFFTLLLYIFVLLVLLLYIILLSVRVYFIICQRLHESHSSEQT